MSHKTRPGVPIAIVGVAALFPGSTEANGFWRDILTGRDLITDVPVSHWLAEDYFDPDPSKPDKVYCKRGSFLSPIDVDPMEYGMPPTQFQSTDTSQLLSLVVARQVLHDATQGKLERLRRERISVILGVTSGQKLYVEMANRLQRPVWVKALRESGLPEDEVTAICDRISGSYVPWTESTFPGALGNVVAGRIANRFDLGGTNCVTDAACASTMAAFQMSINELYLGQADMVITGGVDTFSDPSMYMCFSKTPALSPTGRCRPFDEQGDGTLLGEGLGMFALKRLDDAEKDGDRIYAVLKGLGTSSDGRALSVYAPLAAGQARAVSRAYEKAGFSPATVEMVEAHGTGTKAGDVAEFSGLSMAFDQSGRSDRQWCAVGAVKSQIGHAKAAAGAAGLFKAVMALHHKVLPPTIHVDHPNPRLEVEKSPFYLNTESRPWVRSSDHPRRAGVSSFGFGGSNFHAVLEEYTGPARRADRLWVSPVELALLSDEGPKGLAGRCRKLAAEVKAVAGGSLTFWARQSQEAHDPKQPARLAVVATDEADFERKLLQAADAIDRQPESAFTAPGLYYTWRAEPGDVAFLFPGQGSQYVGMTADLCIAFEGPGSVWDRTGDLQLSGGARLSDFVFPRPAFSDAAREEQARQLTATERAQPALGAASLACLALLGQAGVQPAMVGGHSFGELTALHAAGVLTADAMLLLARRRGELMAEAAQTPGAMTAVPMARADVETLLSPWGLPVGVANDNSPRQVVLSGTVEAIADVESRLQSRGITARRLPVSTAFHSAIVAGARKGFREYVETVPFSPMRLPVYSNAAAAAYPADAETARTWLSDQLERPVRFTEMIEAMYRQGARTFVEVGPGSILSGLVEQCLEGRPAAVVAMDRRGQHGLTGFWNAMGRLAVAGVPLSLSALWTGVGSIEDPRSRRRPAMTIPVSGANCGKNYPPAGGAAALPRPNPARPEPVPSPHRTETPSAASAVPSVTSPATSAGGDVDVEVLRHAAAAHEAFQKAMNESHARHVKSMEASFAAFCSVLSSSTPSAIESPRSRDTFTWAQTGAVQQVDPTRVSLDLPVPVPLTAAPDAPMVAAAIPVPAPVPQAAAPAPTNGRSFTSILLEVVSEKTGYPTEMLALDMALEADLGIDSIKRVEILAALQGRVHGLTPIEPSAMGRLRTLGQIVEAVGAPTPEPPARVVAVVADPAAVLLQVVAEKTGYPPEMLNLDMALEADLGIDSIKRVEILAALQEKIPAMPHIEPANLGRLRTLGQIVEAMGTTVSAMPPVVVAPTAPAPPSISAAAALRRYVVREVPAPGTGRRVEIPGPVAVFGWRDKLTSALVSKLRSEGLDAREVDDVPSDARTVFYLRGLKDFPDVGSALAVNPDAFCIAKAFAPQAEGGMFVTVQDTGGDFGTGGRDARRAWSGGLAGLARTAALEWSGTRVRAIDLEQAGQDVEVLAERLFQELLTDSSEVDVGLHADGTRTTLQADPSELETGPSSVNEQSILVVSGGARGVTGEVLRALARQARPRLVLLGRTALEDEPAACRNVEGDANLKKTLLEAARTQGRTLNPQELGGQVRTILAAREVRETVRALETAGSPVRYLAVDVQNAAALRDALQEVRAGWGPITGLIHGAGVLADKRIADKTLEQFSQVFDTKVRGLEALLAATENDPLEVIVLFSSVAARTGNLGQSDYAMANEVLNKVAAAEAQRRRSCLVRAIGWGPWEGGMVTPSLKAHFESLGVALIPRADGVRHFVAELQDRSVGQAEVVVGGLLPGPKNGAQAPLVHNFQVDARTAPWLDGHRVQDVPVLPVVQVLEWFAETAASVCPDRNVFRCEDLKVLKGIRLPGYDGVGHAFRVVCHTLEDEALGMRLLGSDGTVHYTATVYLKPEAGRPPETFPKLAALNPPSWPAEDVYGRMLFHGPSFHVIRSVEGFSDQGLVGLLDGGQVKGWPSASPRVDAAALDGGLQLARVWGVHMLGRPSLPTRLGAVVIHRPGWMAGPIRCIVMGRADRPYRTVTDIWFLDAENRVVAEMRDVEMHVVGGEVTEKQAVGAEAR